MMQKPCKRDLIQRKTSGRENPLIYCSSLSGGQSCFDLVGWYEAMVVLKVGWDEAAGTLGVG